MPSLASARICAENSKYYLAVFRHECRLPHRRSFFGADTIISWRRSVKGETGDFSIAATSEVAEFLPC